MEAEEIIKGNKLIAEFMGLKLFSENVDGNGIEYWWSEDAKKITSFNGTWMFEDAPAFNKIWDWLMPVVEKIEKVKGVRVLIGPVGCEIMVFGSSKTNEVANSKIEAVYLAVVQFITWYNSTKQP